MAADRPPRAPRRSTRAASSLAAVLRNRDIRNLELAWTLGVGVDWALLVVALARRLRGGWRRRSSASSRSPGWCPATLVNVSSTPGASPGRSGRWSPSASSAAAAAAVMAAAIVARRPARSSSSRSPSRPRPAPSSGRPHGAAARGRHHARTSSSPRTSSRALGEGLGTFAGRSSPGSRSPAPGRRRRGARGGGVRRRRGRRPARPRRRRRPPAARRAAGAGRRSSRAPASCAGGPPGGRRHGLVLRPGRRSAAPSRPTSRSSPSRSSGWASRAWGILGAAIGVGGLVGAVVALALRRAAGARRDPRRWRSCCGASRSRSSALVPVPAVALVALGVDRHRQRAARRRRASRCSSAASRTRSRSRRVLGPRGRASALAIRSGGVARGACCSQRARDRGGARRSPASSCPLARRRVAGRSPAASTRGAVVPERPGTRSCAASRCSAPLPLAALERLASGMRQASLRRRASR